MNKKIYLIIILIVLAAGVYIFITNNSKIIDKENISVPINYTLDNYSVAETSNISCKKSKECITPGKYLMMSSCPYTSLCINNKCNVVCPEYKKDYDADKTITDAKIGICTKKAGVWYQKEGICEVNQLSEADCKDTGGEFNSCASACRHDPKAEVCTMQCVLTCTFR